MVTAATNDDDDDDDDGTVVIDGDEIVVISSPQRSCCVTVHEVKNPSTSVLYLIAHNTVGEFLVCANRRQTITARNLVKLSFFKSSPSKANTSKLSINASKSIGISPSWGSRDAHPLICKILDVSLLKQGNGSVMGVGWKQKDIDILLYS